MIDKLATMSAGMVDKMMHGGQILISNSDNIKKGAAVITSGLGIVTAIQKLKNVLGTKDDSRAKKETAKGDSVKKGLDNNYVDNTLTVIN